MSVDELATAAALGKIELVTLLLQKAVDVNGINRFQRTPVQVGKFPPTLPLSELGPHGRKGFEM